MEQLGASTSERGGNWSRACGRFRMKPTVSDKRILARRELQLAQFGVEREHACGSGAASSGGEEGALAGVGVADQCDGGHGDGFTTLALLGADAADGVKLLLEVKQAALNAAAIGLQLSFAGAAGADAAAELGHFRSAAGEPGQHVFQLGELDLKLAFAGAGVAGEDIQNELGPVDDTTGQLPFKIAQLRRSKVVVEEDEVGVGRNAPRASCSTFSPPLCLSGSVREWRWRRSTRMTAPALVTSSRNSARADSESISGRAEAGGVGLSTDSDRAIAASRASAADWGRGFLRAANSTATSSARS